MGALDEPVIETNERAAADRPPEPSLRDRVRRLVETQPYAVLCTQGDGQPYGSLVAFAATTDLRHAVFATPTTTRKYRLLSACRQVALICDDRSTNTDDLMRIEAVTATGIAEEVGRGGPSTPWRDLLLSRHPYLEAFVAAETCALFRVDIVRYFHVVRFQRVGQWTPTDFSSSR